MTIKIPASLWKASASCPLFDHNNWRPTAGKRSRKGRIQRWDDPDIGGAVPLNLSSTATMTHHIGDLHFSLAVAVQRLVRLAILIVVVNVIAC